MPGATKRVCAINRETTYGILANVCISVSVLMFIVQVFVHNVCECVCPDGLHDHTQTLGWLLI